MPDPYRGFNFRVEIDGITEAGFQECSGLDINTEPVEYREGTDPNHMRKLTGLNKFSPIMLKRGITDSDALWRWQQMAATGRTERRNVSIVLVNETGTEEVLRWNLRRAWPSKWTGPSFNATSNDIAIEELEVCHEELVRG
jgi:phage tail-like protein